MGGGSSLAQRETVGCLCTAGFEDGFEGGVCQMWIELMCSGVVLFAAGGDEQWWVFPMDGPSLKSPPELEQATTDARSQVSEDQIQPAVAIDTKSVRYRPMK
jgi:hypothetical protein